MNKRWAALFLFIALGMGALGAGPVMRESKTLTAPTDSIAVDELEIPLGQAIAWRAVITDTLDGVDRIRCRMQASLDGTTWTTLTEAVDSDLTDVAIGTSGSIILTADSLVTYYFVRPGHYQGTAAIGSIGSDLANARLLMYASHFRVTVDSIIGAYKGDPEIDMQVYIKR